MHCFDGTNETNFWHVSYNHWQFYMISMPYQQVDYPAKLDAVWYQEVCHNERGILRRTRSATEAGLLQHDDDTISLQQELSVMDDANGEVPNQQLMMRKPII